MKFTEAQLETSFISLLELEGYDYIHGEEVIRDSKEEVLIEEDLRAFLIATYPDLEEVELQSIVHELAYQPASDLYNSNKYICKLLADGFIFKRNDHAKKDLHIRFINVKDTQRSEERRVGKER